MARRRIETKPRVKRTVSSREAKTATVVKFSIKQTGDIEGAMQDLRRNSKNFLGKLVEHNMDRTIALSYLQWGLGEHYFIGMNYCQPIIEEMEQQNLIKVDWKSETFTVLK